MIPWDEPTAAAVVGDDRQLKLLRERTPQSQRVDAQIHLTAASVHRLSRVEMPRLKLTHSR